MKLKKFIERLLIFYFLRNNLKIIAKIRKLKKLLINQYIIN